MRSFLSRFYSIETFPPFGVDYISWIDVLMLWVPVLVVVFVVLVAPVVLPGSLGGVSLSGPLLVDAREDTTFLHHMVRLGMKLARPFKVLL